MKYRIKIVTYKSGRVAYFAQVKQGWWWRGLDHEGKHYNFDLEARDREACLRRIDLHFKGNQEKHTIEFEYIQK